MTRTREPMTTVPVRELTMTRAGASPGSISMASSVARYAVRWLGSAGAATFTDTPSTDCAVPSPSNLLMPSARRADVVKSGECRLSMTKGSVVKPFGTSRSTVAPFGTRPAEGTLTAMLRAVLAGNAEAADHQAALRDGVHLAVGADQRRHDQTTAAQAAARCRWTTR